MLLPATKKPFIKVGERVRFIGSSRGRYGTWPKDAWLEKGVIGTVKEYHPEQPAGRAGGEYFEALPPYAVVRWDFGGDTVIDPDDEGKRWERIHNEKVLPFTISPTGTCYQDAWRYVMRHVEDHPVLAHGTIVGLRGRMNHAWVELPDGTVWDPSAQVPMPIEKYYSLVDPIVEDRYTADEAAHMLSVGKHGPWSAEERMKYIGR